jgi:uncharacterized protein (DUF4415 family)
MVKRKSESYRREKQPAQKPKSMKKHPEEFDRELAALVQMADKDIDTSEMPELRDWSGAEVGRFYRPIKEPVTLRVDADVLVWLKAGGPGYQTRINSFLREAMNVSLEADSVSAPTEQVAEAEREFSFPGLEKHGELGKCDEMAEEIEMRHSVFAPVA